MNIWTFIEELPKNFDPMKEVRVVNEQGTAYSIAEIHIDLDGNLLIHYLEN